jgi:hypothetical protein
MMMITTLNRNHIAQQQQQQLKLRHLTVIRISISNVGNNKLLSSHRHLHCFFKLTMSMM